MTISKANLTNTPPMLDQVIGRNSGSATGAGDSKRPAPDALAKSVDSVKLSPLSEKLKAMSRELGDAGIDQARVNELRHAISNGTYKINASAIAEKLLADASVQRDK